MIKIHAALLMALLAPGAFGATWTVCVEDSGELLNTPLRASVLREFRELMGGRGADLGFGTCRRDSRRIRLEIQVEPLVSLRVSWVWPIAEASGLSHGSRCSTGRWFGTWGTRTARN